jgi:hypothetical protein
LRRIGQLLENTMTIILTAPIVDRKQKNHISREQKTFRRLCFESVYTENSVSQTFDLESLTVSTLKCSQVRTLLPYMCFYRMLDSDCQPPKSIKYVWTRQCEARCTVLVSLTILFRIVINVRDDMKRH